VIDDAAFDDAVAAIKILAEPNRLTILAVLTAEELSVGEVQHRLGLPQSLTSSHLRTLHRAGLVRRRRAGTRRYDAINHDSWDAAMRAITAVFDPEISSD
jgi:DNA-binding transcriptional ArsR family regulator